MRRRRIALVTFVLLAGIVAVPVVLTWRQMQQEPLNRALIAAVNRNDTAGVRTLLRQGADPNAQVLPPDTRPMWKRLLDLLRHGSATAPTSSRGTVLAAAISWHPVDDAAIYDINHDYDRKNAGIVEALADAGADVNIRFAHTFAHPMMRPRQRIIMTTPLVEAARLNQWQTMKVLLAHHADVNAADDYRGATALMYAAVSEQTEMVKALVSQGAAVNARDLQGETALFWALHAQMTMGDSVDIVMDRPYSGPRASVCAIVTYLLQHGASVDVRDRSGSNILSLAQEWHDPQLIQMLKRAGAK